MAALNGFNAVDLTAVLLDVLIELFSENTFQVPVGSDKLTELFPPL